MCVCSPNKWKIDFCIHLRYLCYILVGRRLLILNAFYALLFNLLITPYLLKVLINKAWIHTFLVLILAINSFVSRPYVVNVHLSLLLKNSFNTPSNGGSRHLPPPESDKDAVSVRTKHFLLSFYIAFPILFSIWFYFSLLLYSRNKNSSVLP